MQRFWGKQPRFTRFCCISLSQAIAICAPVLEKKSDFHTSGLLNLSPFFFFFFHKWFLRETEESCREPHNNTVACSLGGMPVSVWTITMMSLVKPFLFPECLFALHIWDTLVRQERRILGTSYLIIEPHLFPQRNLLGNHVHNTSERDV